MWTDFRKEVSRIGLVSYTSQKYYSSLEAVVSELNSFSISRPKPVHKNEKDLQLPDSANTSVVGFTVLPKFVSSYFQALCGHQSRTVK